MVGEEVKCGPATEPQQTQPTRLGDVGRRVAGEVSLNNDAVLPESGVIRVGLGIELADREAKRGGIEGGGGEIDAASVEGGEILPVTHGAIPRIVPSEPVG